MRQGMIRKLAASAMAIAAVALLAGNSFAGSADNANDARYDDAQRNQWATLPPGTVLNAGQSQYVVPAVPAPAPYALTGSNATEDTGSDYWAHQVPVQVNVGNGYVYIPVATR